MNGLLPSMLATQPSYRCLFFFFLRIRPPPRPPPFPSPTLFRSVTPRRDGRRPRPRPVVARERVDRAVGVVSQLDVFRRDPAAAARVLLGDLRQEVHALHP